MLKLLLSSSLTISGVGVRMGTESQENKIEHEEKYNEIVNAVNFENKFDINDYLKDENGNEYQILFNENFNEDDLYQILLKQHEQKNEDEINTRYIQFLEEYNRNIDNFYSTYDNDVTIDNNVIGNRNWWCFLFSCDKRSTYEKEYDKLNEWKNKKTNKKIEDHINGTTVEKRENLLGSEKIEKHKVGYPKEISYFKKDRHHHIYSTPDTYCASGYERSYTDKVYYSYTTNHYSNRKNNFYANSYYYEYKYDTKWVWSWFNSGWRHINHRHDIYKTGSTCAARNKESKPSTDQKIYNEKYWTTQVEVQPKVLSYEYASEQVTKKFDNFYDIKRSTDAIEIYLDGFSMDGTGYSKLGYNKRFHNAKIIAFDSNDFNNLFEYYPEKNKFSSIIDDENLGVLIKNNQKFSFTTMTNSLSNSFGHLRIHDFEESLFKVIKKISDIKELPIKLYGYSTGGFIANKLASMDDKDEPIIMEVNTYASPISHSYMYYDPIYATVSNYIASDWAKSTDNISIDFKSKNTLSEINNINYNNTRDTKLIEFNSHSTRLHPAYTTILAGWIFIGTIAVAPISPTLALLIGLVGFEIVNILYNTDLVVPVAAQRGDSRYYKNTHYDTHINFEDALIPHQWINSII